MGKLAIFAAVCVISCGGAAASTRVTLTPTASASVPAQTGALPPQPTSPPPHAACARRLEGTSICFAGGQGASIQDAVVIQGAHGEGDGVPAEYKYLENLYGPRGQGYTVSGQSLLENGGKSFDRLDIVVQGQPKAVYFDITDYFGKF